jgi:FkbM family methyltransferase
MAMRWWSRGRFDVVELCLVAALVGIGAATVARETAGQEAKALIRAYGQPQYSEGLEEVVIRDYFEEKRGGVFVDIGAADYRTGSNTYYLEKHLGWSGIAVDALPSYREGYTQHRPSTRFFVYFVSDHSRGRATVYVPKDTRQTADWKRPEYGPANEIDVPTITLTELLLEQRVTRVDLLSVDVELAEPRVLAGFDIDRFRPALVCIEAWPPVRQRILDYFARHGYVVVGKYLRADPINLYFTPAAQ